MTSKPMLLASSTQRTNSAPYILTHKTSEPKPFQIHLHLITYKNPPSTKSC